MADCFYITIITDATDISSAMAHILRRSCRRAGDDALWLSWIESTVVEHQQRALTVCMCVSCVCVFFPKNTCITVLITCNIKKQARTKKLDSRLFSHRHQRKHHRHLQLTSHTSRRVHGQADDDELWLAGIESMSAEHQHRPLAVCSACFFQNTLYHGHTQNNRSQ